MEDPGPIAAKIQDQVQARVDAGVDPEAYFWRITPFIDFAKPDSVCEDWRWEREWRVPGGLRFKPEDVAFLFVPEEYLCPYIDPRWPKDRIEKALKEVPPAQEPSPEALHDPLDDWNDPHPLGA